MGEPLMFRMKCPPPAYVQLGATDLLLAKVDPDVIRLIGRWRSDEMLQYLHVQAYPLMRDYARQMLSARMYTIIPNHLVPQR